MATPADADPEEQSEPTASDLLPPDDPPPMPRRIGERRVVGHRLAGRLMHRLQRRPVGNSRVFWSRIEDDDPFDALAPRAAPARTAPAPTPTAPRPKPKPRPKPAATPATPARASATPSAPDPAQPVDRRPPRAPDPVVRSRRASPSAGRIPVSRSGVSYPRAEEVPEPPQPAPKRPAKRNLGGRPEAPPKRSIDEVLQALGELSVAEQQYDEGRARKEAEKRKTASEPPRRAGPASLDDLMGPSREGRASIGRRSRPRRTSDDDS